MKIVFQIMIAKAYYLNILQSSLCLFLKFTQSSFCLFLKFTTFTLFISEIHTVFIQFILEIYKLYLFLKFTQSSLCIFLKFTTFTLFLSFTQSSHCLFLQIFVGLGFPYEGPAPLEAIANGAVFLNPKFDPPHNSKNNKFFKGKPTQREVSAHRYFLYVNPYIIYVEGMVCMEGVAY